MRTWAVIIGMGVLTYALRVIPIVMIERFEIPPLLSRALRLVPPAVLSALIVPAVLRPAGSWELSFTNARLLAGGLAMVVAWRTRSMLLTIAAGMAALWILRWLIR